jgi:hypothetical protein
MEFADTDTRQTGARSPAASLSEITVPLTARATLIGRLVPTFVFFSIGANGPWIWYATAGATTVVGSVAVSFDASDSPPPDAVTEFVTLLAALLATSVVRVIAG